MNDKQAKYAEILKLAKASESEAIRLYTTAMGYAPPEDLPKLAEILNDENDHDVITTDLLFKAMTGSTAEQEELVPGVD
jgi:rubrerythrin